MLSTTITLVLYGNSSSKPKGDHFNRDPFTFAPSCGTHLHGICFMNLLSWVKSIKQIFYGTLMVCMLRLCLYSGGGVEGIESSADSITNDSSAGSSSVVKQISVLQMKVTWNRLHRALYIAHTPHIFVHVSAMNYCWEISYGMIRGWVMATLPSSCGHTGSTISLVNIFCNWWQL